MSGKYEFSLCLLVPNPGVMTEYAVEGSDK